MNNLNFTNNCKTILSESFVTDKTDSIETSIIKFYNTGYSESCYSIDCKNSVININQCFGKLLYDIKIYSNPVYQCKSHQHPIQKNLIVSIQ